MANLTIFSLVNPKLNDKVLLANTCRCSLRLLGSRLSMSNPAMGLTDIEIRLANKPVETSSAKQTTGYKELGCRRRIPGMKTEQTAFCYHTEHGSSCVAAPTPPPRVVPRRAPLPSAASSCEHDTFTVYIESQFVRSVSPSLP